MGEDRWLSCPGGSHGAPTMGSCWSKPLRQLRPTRAPWHIRSGGLLSVQPAPGPGGGQRFMDGEFRKIRGKLWAKERKTIECGILVFAITLFNMFIHTRVSPAGAHRYSGLVHSLRGIPGTVGAEQLPWPHPLHARGTPSRDNHRHPQTSPGVRCGQNRPR